RTESRSCAGLAAGFSLVGVCLLSARSLQASHIAKITAKGSKSFMMVFLRLRHRERKDVTTYRSFQSVEKRAAKHARGPFFGFTYEWPGHVFWYTKGAPRRGSPLLHGKVRALGRLGCGSFVLDWGYSCPEWPCAGRRC